LHLDFHWFPVDLQVHLSKEINKKIKAQPERVFLSYITIDPYLFRLLAGSGSLSSSECGPSKDKMGLKKKK
jgi:hypothetical protein